MLQNQGVLASPCATLAVCNAPGHANLLPSLHSRVGSPCAAAPHAQRGEGFFHVQAAGTQRKAKGEETTQ